MEKSEKLVLIEDLYNGDILKISKMNQLNVLLNQPPKEEWIENHPMVKKVKYLPIGKVEFLLTAIFQQWKVEIKEMQTIANSVVIIVRLHYMHPIKSTWDYQDGVGAAVISTRSGAKAMDWNEVNSMSVMQAVPAAKSYAIKDAAELLGKIFGKDINRDKGLSDYAVLQHKFKVNEDEALKQVKKHFSEALDYSQDEEAKKEIIEEVLEAEASGADNIDFFLRLTKKIVTPSK